MPPSVPSRLPASARSATVTLQLEPLPPADKLTTEELLLLVKKRLEQIHAAMGRP
jgi:hypothetical protein